MRLIFATESQLWPVLPSYYRSDTGSAYDGTMLAGRRGVIIVTFNYRLGALGFLNTGNEGLMLTYAHGT